MAARKVSCQYCGQRYVPGTHSPCPLIVGTPLEASRAMALQAYPAIGTRLADWRASTGDGTLPAYAWPGGYPVAYITQDGLTICPKCANETDTSDPVIAGDVYWEGPALVCDDGSQCGAMVGGSRVPSMIESAYGDPDASEDELRAADDAAVRAVGQWLEAEESRLS